MSLTNILSKDEFFKLVNERNTTEDGNIKDTDLLRRMSHPICQKCHEDYKIKFPGKPFAIVCQGIYDDIAIAGIAKQADIPIELAREVIDPIYWAEKNINLANDDGDPFPFISRDYQEPILRCTAMRKVDRLCRGSGKTTMAIIKELHTVITRKNYPILILCPAKAQAQLWFDSILWQCEQNPDIANAIESKRQQPYYRIRFLNGSSLSIFTAGSSSGRDANVVRTQNPRRVRLEEQDQLNDGDYKALMALIRRFNNSEFHGSSTPTGARSIYWQMCTQYEDYREFYASLHVLPNYTPELEVACRREARTEVVFQHEFLAEFGDLEAGVFKTAHIDACRSPYKYSMTKYDPTKKYVMGVDWNGGGTGTRIRVVEFDEETKIRKVVDHATVDSPTSTTSDSIKEIRDKNRYWHCAFVYIDAGFGFAQDELLRLLGQQATNYLDKRLQDIKVIDFGATLTFNKLVPKRGYEKYIQEQELERRTKPFMVEGSVIALEQHLFSYSEADSVLDDQLRAYKVKTWSSHGWANTYDCGKVGDHDLDATMLALLGIELEYGLFANHQVLPLAQMVHLTGFGREAPDVRPIDEIIEHKKELQEKTQDLTKQSNDDVDAYRVSYLMKHGAYVVPNEFRQNGNRIQSRTSMFKNEKKGPGYPLGAPGPITRRGR